MSEKMRFEQQHSPVMCRITGYCRYILFSLILPQFAIVSTAFADNNDDVMGDGLGQPFGHVSRRAWSEQEVQLPPAPEDDRLIALKIFEIPSYKFYIDAGSINVAAGDNVARYTVVIEPPSGLRNVFYEGIRCDTGEYKTYATALWGQALNPSTSAPWYDITETGMNVYRNDLFRYFLCENSIIKGNKTEIVKLLESPPDDFIDEVLE